MPFAIFSLWKICHWHLKVCTIWPLNIQFIGLQQVTPTCNQRVVLPFIWTHKISKEMEVFMASFPLNKMSYFRTCCPTIQSYLMHHCLLLNRGSFTNNSLLQMIVCNSSLTRKFKSMSQENERAHGIAVSTIEIVDLIEYIVVMSLPSTRCKTSCGVYCSHNESNVTGIKSVLASLKHLYVLSQIWDFNIKFEPDLSNVIFQSCFQSSFLTFEIVLQSI